MYLSFQTRERCDHTFDGHANPFARFQLFLVVVAVGADSSLLHAVEVGAGTVVLPADREAGSRRKEAAEDGQADERRP